MIGIFWSALLIGFHKPWGPRNCLYALYIISDINDWGWNPYFGDPNLMFYCKIYIPFPNEGFSTTPVWILCPNKIYSPQLSVLFFFSCDIFALHAPSYSIPTQFLRFTLFLLLSAITPVLFLEFCYLLYFSNVLTQRILLIKFAKEDK